MLAGQSPHLHQVCPRVCRDMPCTRTPWIAFGEQGLSNSTCCSGSWPLQLQLVRAYAPYASLILNYWLPARNVVVRIACAAPG
jgi:hypothetical protein